MFCDVLRGKLQLQKLGEKEKEHNTMICEQKSLVDTQLMCHKMYVKMGRGGAMYDFHGCMY